MKAKRSIFAAFLALTMIIAMAVPAVAAPTTPFAVGNTHLGLSDAKWKHSNNAKLDPSERLVVTVKAVTDKGIAIKTVAARVQILSKTVIAVPLTSSGNVYSVSTTADGQEFTATFNYKELDGSSYISYPKTISIVGYEIVDVNNVKTIVEKSSGAPYTWLPTYTINKKNTSTGNGSKDKGGSNSIYGGGSATSATKPTSTTTIKTDGTVLIKALESVPAGGTATVRGINQGEMTADTINKLKTTAAKKNTKVTMRFDQTTGKKIVSRIDLPLEKLSQQVAVTVYTDSKNATTVKTRFGKHYANELFVMEFTQACPVGTNATVSILHPMKKTNELKFYSYDIKTNKYALLNGLAYTIDANGYLVFNVDPNACIIVSDGLLRLK